MSDLTSLQSLFEMHIAPYSPFKSQWYSTYGNSAVDAWSFMFDFVELARPLLDNVIYYKGNCVNENQA